MLPLCYPCKFLELPQGQIWLNVLKYFFVFNTRGCIYLQSNMSLITNISLCNGISPECIGHLAHKNNQGLIQSPLKSSTKLPQFLMGTESGPSFSALRGESCIKS